MHIIIHMCNRFTSAYNLNILVEHSDLGDICADDTSTDECAVACFVSSCCLDDGKPASCYQYFQSTCDTYRSHCGPPNSASMLAVAAEAITASKSSNALWANSAKLMAQDRADSMDAIIVGAPSDDHNDRSPNEQSSMPSSKPSAVPSDSPTISASPSMQLPLIGTSPSESPSMDPTDDLLTPKLFQDAETPWLLHRNTIVEVIVNTMMMLKQFISQAVLESSIWNSTHIR